MSFIFSGTPCRAASVLHTIAHLNEYWFTSHIITEEFVTLGNGMRPTGKIITYLSGLSYLDTRNNLLIVIRTIQSLYWQNSHILAGRCAKFHSNDAKFGGFMTFWNDVTVIKLSKNCDVRRRCGPPVYRYVLYGARNDTKTNDWKDKFDSTV